MQGTRARSTRKESVSSRNFSLGVVSYCSQRVELPGEVARLLSKVHEEKSTLERDQTTRWTYTSIANTSGSSANSHSHSLSLPSSQGQGQHSLSHSRSSSNLGDDADRDGNWDDDEPGSGGPGGGLSGDAFDGLHIQTAIGASSPLSLGGPSPSLHSHSLSLHAHSPSPQPPSPSEKWRRWAETEVNKEMRRVDKLVGVIRTLVEYVNPGSAGSGQGGTTVGIGKGGECADEGKFSYAFYVFAANKLV